MLLAASLLAMLPDTEQGSKMSFLKQQWLQRMQAIAISLPPLYAGIMLVLVFIGYGFLLLFPLLALASLLMFGLILWQSPLNSWQLHDGLILASLPAISALCLFQTIQIYRARPALPPGRPLLRKNFPVLRERIDELCKTYASPKIHQVKLNSRFAIEVICTPQNGFPLRCTNTLLIGLPIMSCMSPLQLKLLLGREIGHLALRRRHYRRRIPQLAHIWQQYANSYSERWTPGTFMLRLFFVPFAAVFSNTAYPATRAECFIKDMCMLDITPTNNAAETISAVAIKRRHLNQQYWPTLNHKAFYEPRPPYLPYSSMANIVNSALDRKQSRLNYEAEIASPVASDDIRPNLRERLVAIGYDDFVVPEATTTNAADHFLGSFFAEIQKQMDNIWYLKNRGVWAMRYKRGIEEKKRLAILREQAAHALLSNDEAREFLLLIEKYVAPEKALTFYKEILKTNSLDAHVCYEVGRLLLAADDETGVATLHMAMDIAAELTADSCQHIIDYLTRHGDTKLAHDYRRKIIEHQVES